MKSEEFKKLKIPDTPGVYFFKKGKEILYVGKATSLKDRIKSYFGKDLIETRGPILVDLISKADKISWQKTDSVLEALILEAELIKKHQPKYNTKEKSDTSFNHVGITSEKIPQVLVVRGKDIRHHAFKKVFGPYPSGGDLRLALKIIRPVFPFLDAKSLNVYTFYRQIGLVPDVSFPDGIKVYKENLKNLVLFFEGKKKKVLENLEKQMKKSAKAQDFERAGEIKKQIFSLRHINDVALLNNRGSGAYERTLGRSDGDGQRKFLAENFRGESGSTRAGIKRIEAYDIAHMNGKSMVGVMVVVEEGEVAKNEYRKFKIRTQENSNDTGALAEVLSRRFAHAEWKFPDLMVTDGGTAQLNAARGVISKFNLDIDVVSVLKDERHQPKEILGDRKLAEKYKKEILLANSEAHRFAIAYHKKARGKNFIK